MRFQDFENVMSAVRISRYVTACGGNTKKAMTLYRKNLQLSQELFTVISCFEISLRNAIDKHCLKTLGNDWLKYGASASGIFDNNNCRVTTNIINKTTQKIRQHYTHSKLVAELGFGFWRYMFAQHQYVATGRVLLKIFPAKPVSTRVTQYNNIFIFNRLADINDLRNRIAHHEPICFQRRFPIVNLEYAKLHYGYILQLFQWMQIDESALLYGIDHVNTLCNEISHL